MKKDYTLMKKDLLLSSSAIVADYAQQTSTVPIFSFNHSGSVTVKGLSTPKVPPGKFNGVYVYSDKVLARLKQAELAIIGKSNALGYEKTHLITLTFPSIFDNSDRMEINDRFRKNIRMRYKQGGLWCVEAHTKSKTKGVYGLYHIHYRIITSERRSDVVDWVRRQQEKDGVDINSYDVDKRFTGGSIYQSLYTSKQDQKNLVSHSGRIWASWGIDKEPLSLSLDEIANFIPVYNKYDRLQSCVKDCNTLIQAIKLSAL